MVCAERELFEETGYRASEIKKLLSLKSTVAFCDELIDVYLATGLKKEGTQKLDPAEAIDIRAYSLDELISMIFDFTLQDSKTVAGILAYKALSEK